MAAITQIEVTNPRGHLCETIAITNQVANTTVVTKAIPVPKWARDCTLVIGNLTMTGTSPLLDFAVYGYDSAANSNAQPDDGYLYLLTGWAGITQKTGATATYTTIDIGPTIAADTTGSATAPDRYAIQSLLPPWLVYKYTTDGTSDDEDYAATITVYFK